jgi:DNA (cytosine-5)-methyltransferase 1
MFLKLQKMANSSIRGGGQPAQTIAFGHDSASAQWFETLEEAEAHLPSWGYRDRPAPTVTGGGGRASGIELFDQQSRKKLVAKINAGEAEGNGRVVNPNTPLDPIRLTIEEAAILQSYPPTRPVWTRDRPATTLLARAEEVSAPVSERRDPRSGAKSNAIRVTVEEASKLQSYPTIVATGQNSKQGGGKTKRYSKSTDVPAPTVTGQGRSWRLGEGDESRNMNVDEASQLQTFPPVETFTWPGGKTETFQQIGNAVPPLQARVVFEALWHVPVDTSYELAA